MDRRALKLIDALPTDFQNHFVYEPDEKLMADNGVSEILEQVSTHVGRRRPSDDKELMDQFWNSNDRGKGESLATWLIRRLREFHQCRDELSVIILDR